MPERATEKARSLWRDEEGSALVEATIVMPLLLSLFLGVFEFSWFFYNQQLVVSGLRDAARYMTRIELTDGNRDPCAQKDQNGLLYTADAANIATTAEATGGSARATRWCGRFRHVSGSRRRASIRTWWSCKSARQKNPRMRLSCSAPQPFRALRRCPTCPSGCAVRP